MRKTNAEIQRDYKQRQRDAGLERFEEWLTPCQKEKVIKYIKRIRK